MGIRKITENDSWVTNNDGDLVGIKLAGRSEDNYVDLSNPVNALTNPVTGVSIKTLWVGTQAQYDAIAVKDANTQYNIVAA